MIRHEHGLWSMWRVDKSARYLLKARRHVRQPASAEDAEHFRRVQAHLRSGSWRRTTGDSARALKLVGAGDLMWIKQGWDSHLAPSLSERLAAADARFVNLETPIIDGQAVPAIDLFRYNAPRSLLAPWPRPTVLSLSNNHSLDFGVDGLNATERSVRDAGHEPVRALSFIEVRGVRIACVATTYGFNRKGPSADLLVAPFAMRAFDWTALEALLARARREADLVVLQPHWSYEYEYYPSAALREAAYRLITLGVDVIFGSSPHVVQPLELVSIDGYDPAAPTQLSRGGAPRAGVICYSLGNFASLMPTLACRSGALVELGLSASGALSALNVLPTVTHGHAALAEESSAEAAHVRKLILGIEGKMMDPTITALPKLTADKVTPLMHDLDLGHYRRFLNMMFHYTRKSGARLQWAAEHVPHADLREFFAQLAKEEAGHYRLAEADLKALGSELESAEPPAPVRDFERFWEELGHERFCGYLGALYVLENVGEHMKAATLASLSQLPLDKTQVRFIMVHLQEDVEHGERTRALCEKYAQTDLEAMRAGAERASTFWAAMIQTALSK